jgi:hypothetical protein
MSDDLGEISPSGGFAAREVNVQDTEGGSLAQHAQPNRGVELRRAAVKL